MSNIIFWSALLLVPIVIGTAFGWLRHMRHEDDV